tara:strand:+ start:1422 stop:1766 length:345 start_codon:yes stop_codon:yes gene_type:complete
MTEKTLFEKIIDREIPSKIIYEDDFCIAIEDINPQAPVHVLLIPKKPIKKFSDFQKKDKDLIAHIFLKVNEVVKICNISKNFRININNGAEAGQEVFHLHIHILGGRKFSWPPG